MGKKHFTEDQIAFPPRQAESGTSVAEAIRKLKQLVAEASPDKKMLQDVLSQTLGFTMDISGSGFSCTVKDGS